VFYRAGPDRVFTPEISSPRRSRFATFDQVPLPLKPLISYAVEQEVAGELHSAQAHSYEEISPCHIPICTPSLDLN
jgi:hypothetical protein